MYKSIRALMVFLTLVLFLGACLPAQQPAVQETVQNTPSLIDVQAQINQSVAQTVEAQNQIGTSVAQTMESQASSTPSATPFSIPTFTPFVVSTITPWSGGGAGGGSGGGSGGSGSGGSGGGGAGSPQYDCSVVAQKPYDGDRIWKPGDTFDVQWTLKNTGTKKIPADAYFTYFSGDVISPTTGYLLGYEVLPGKTFTLRADVIAPKVAGPDKEQFTMQWALIVLGNKICKPYLAIFVQRR